jgi:hypothetical protein
VRRKVEWFERPAKERQICCKQIENVRDNNLNAKFAKELHENLGFYVDQPGIQANLG